MVSPGLPMVGKYLKLSQIEAKLHLISHITYNFKWNRVATFWNY